MPESQSANHAAPKGNLDAVVSDKLRRDILTGELASGTHLSELKISKEYGVSRTPVREALCALAADGLIEMIPNRGAFVASPSLETIRENRILYGDLKALAARQAAVKISAEDITQLEQILSRLDSPGPAFEEAREAFHNRLDSIAAIPALTDVTSFLTRRLPQPVLPVAGLANEAGMVRQGYAYFLRALQSRKPDITEKAMRDVMALNFSVSQQDDGQDDGHKNQVA